MRSNVFVYLCIDKVYLLKGNTPEEGLWIEIINPINQCSMKKHLFVILTVLCALLASVQWSHAQNIYNANGQQVAKVESDGTLRDRNNHAVGKIDRDGTIRDERAHAVGKIESNGTIRNERGQAVGKVESDGTVRDDHNSKVGKIESDGTVRDRQNRSIGKASGVKKEWAAVVIFFRF